MPKLPCVSGEEAVKALQRLGFAFLRQKGSHAILRRGNQGCEDSSIARRVPDRYCSVMSSVAEIESAIERLTPAQVAEVAAWLDEYQQMINASAEIFSMYDKEEGQ